MSIKQIVLIRKGHHYIFRWLPGEEKQMMSIIIDKARNGVLDWFDMSILSHQIGMAGTEMVNTALKVAGVKFIKKEDNHES